MFLEEYRCSCGKLLLKGFLFNGKFEIKCRRCGKINTINKNKLKDDASHYSLIFNNQEKITNTSDSACRILGYGDVELHGETFKKVICETSREITRILTLLRRKKSLLNEDNYLEFDASHQTKDGRFIPVSVCLKSYQGFDKEKFVLLLAEIKNIKKKILSNNGINFAKNKFDFYFDIDAKGMEESISKSTEKIFGFSPKMMIGKNFFGSLPVKVKSKDKKIFNHFVSEKESFHISNIIWQNIRKQPTKINLVFTAKFDDSKNFIGYCVLGMIQKKETRA